MAKSSKPKFYAVAKGHRPGIYHDWETCKTQVNGYSAAKYKGFSTQEAAMQFIAENGHLKSGTAVQKSTEAEHDITTKKRKRVHLDDHGTLTAVSLRGSKILKTDPAVVPVEEDGCTVIWTDGSSIGNGQDGAAAGIGVFFGIDDGRNVSERLPGKQTNNRAELTAVIRALQAVDDKVDVVVKTDSAYAINCFTVWHHKWAENGWRNSKRQEVENKKLIQHGLEILQRRTGRTRLVKVKAHIGILGNEMADQLANKGAMMPQV